MIVQPNFLDHWKTRLLVSELGGDEFAPFYLLRLWAHCQNQKKSQFENLTPGALTAICRASIPPKTLFSAMKNSGFIFKENGVVTVHQWDEYNSSLISSWKNGKKGGRPAKPNENPRDTGGIPESNPAVTDREEERRGEKIDETEKREGAGRGAGDSATPPPADTPNVLTLESPPASMPATKPKPANKQTDAEWLASLKASPAYAGIDIDREHAKAGVWCANKGRQLSRQRFINWLNKCDNPLSASAHNAHKPDRINFKASDYHGIHD